MKGVSSEGAPQSKVTPLPYSLPSIINIVVFKQCLKTHLFSSEISCETDGLSDEHNIDLWILFVLIGDCFGNEKSALMDKSLVFCIFRVLNKQLKRLMNTALNIIIIVD